MDINAHVDVAGEILLDKTGQETLLLHHHHEPLHNVNISSQNNQYYAAYCGLGHDVSVTLDEKVT